MINYDVEVDRQGIEDATRLFEFVGGNAADAQRIAINKTGKKYRTLAGRAVREQVRLKARYVNERLRFRRASRSNLLGRISTPSRGLLLSRYSTDTSVASTGIRWLSPPPEPPRGIKVKVKPGGGSEQVTGDSATAGNKPFYMVLANSRALGIAARRNRPGPRGGRIKVFYGPSISQVFAGVKDDLEPQAADEYQHQLLDAMRYLLSRRYPPEA